MQYVKSKITRSEKQKCHLKTNTNRSISFKKTIYTFLNLNNKVMEYTYLALARIHAGIRPLRDQSKATALSMDLPMTSSKSHPVLFNLGWSQKP